MDCHYRLDTAVKLILLKTFLEINRNKPCLPVMAVNQIRTEPDRRQSGKNCLREERKTLDFEKCVIRVRLVGIEKLFIVDEVIDYTIRFRLQNADIHALPVKIHIKAGDVFHAVFHLLPYAGILGKEYPDVIIILVNFLWQRTYDIRKSACFDKRNAFRSYEQNVFHRALPPCGCKHI